jgi:DNA-binding helix-hairpin-helix protein with protein kinase domain
MRLGQVSTMQPGQGAADIDEAALQRGVELGSGAQGWVYRVHGQPEPSAFKKYKNPRMAEPAALKTLTDLPGQLRPSERDRLHQQTAWPLARVYDKGQLSGFLMREIPGQFMAPNSAGAMKKRELQYLLYPRAPLWGDIVPADGVSTQTRVDVAREFTALVTLLHTRTLVIGDVSMLNLLWTGTGGQPVTIFLIDCDGIRKLGQAPVMKQVETPDWLDPHLPPTGLDLDTDRYKLALAVGRILSSQAKLEPAKDPLALPSDLPDRMAGRIEALWKQAAGPYGRRPDANQWLNALADRDEIVLRPLGTVRPRYPTGVDKTDTDPPANAPRQGIPVTPPATPRPRPQAPATPLPRPSIPLRPPAPPPKP